jgi:hypothetical protein
MGIGPHVHTILSSVTIIIMTLVRVSEAESGSGRDVCTVLRMRTQDSRDDLTALPMAPCAPLVGGLVEAIPDLLITRHKLHHAKLWCQRSSGHDGNRVGMAVSEAQMKAIGGGEAFWKDLRGDKMEIGDCSCRPCNVGKVKPLKVEGS